MAPIAHPKHIQPSGTESMPLVAEKNQAIVGLQQHGGYDAAVIDCTHLRTAFQTLGSGVFDKEIPWVKSRRYTPCTAPNCRPGLSRARRVSQDDYTLASGVALGCSSVSQGTWPNFSVADCRSRSK
jgi:hypothetical protein